MVFGCSPPSFDGELAVDYHVWYALGILMRIQELSFFLYSPRVEYHYVSSQSRAQILASIHSPPNSLIKRRIKQLLMANTIAP